FRFGNACVSGTLTGSPAPCDRRAGLLPPRGTDPRIGALRRYSRAFSRRPAPCDEPAGPEAGTRSAISWQAAVAGGRSALRVSFASKLARALGTGAAAVVLAAAWRAAPSAHAQDPQRGAKLFQFCTQCHGADAGGNPQFLAPNLTGLPEWYLVAQLKNFHTGLRGMHPDDVAGMRMFPMTRVFRDEGDIPAVAAHIAQLPVVTPALTISDGDATRGASFYQVCIACHGPDGRGNQALNAPPLVQESDWYLLSSL